MKKMITTALFLMCLIMNATNPMGFVIPKEFKALNTFSGDLTDSDSFHLILTKNKDTKAHKIFSYVFDGESIKELPSINSKESYGVLSYHKSDNLLTLLLTYSVKKESFLKRINYNLLENTITESEPIAHKDYSSSLRLKDRSILLYKNDKDYLKIVDFKSSNEPIIKDYKFGSSKDKVKLFFKGKSISSIRTDEFVPNGAVNDVRLYFDNDKLIFTRDSDEPFDINLVGISLNNKKTNTTEILKFDLNESELSPDLSVYMNQENKKFKKATSYFTDNKLFQLALSKKEGYVKITDVNSKETLNSIALTNDLSCLVQNNPEFIGMEKFLKTAGKNKYNATVTVNKTKSSKLRLRVDYVDISYSYNYNWWWHHQQFMMWQQQQMMHQQMIRSIPAGFGPSIDDDTLVEVSELNNTKRYFEILLDAKGQVLNEELPEAFYKEVDKEKHIKKLEKIIDFKHESSCFLKNSFRFIAYNTDLKQFVIQTNDLD